MPKFSWPACGAVRDRRELEYISALAQSGESIREDGTISAEDIQTFIRSRHGLQVDLHLVDEGLEDLVGISRQNEQFDQDTKYLDIPTLASLLLISFLLRKNDEHNSERNIYEGEDEEKMMDERGKNSHDDIFARVLDIILADLPDTHNYPDCANKGSEKHELGQIESSTQPLKLTKELLSEIFLIYGETQVDDEVLEEMLTVPFTQGMKSKIHDNQILFDRDTFALALTGDINAYDYKLETRHSGYNEDLKTMFCSQTCTSNNQQNIDRDTNKAIDASNTESALEDMISKENEKKLHDPFKPIYTASNVDMNADRMQSDNFLIGFYLLVSVYTVAYFAGYGYIDSLVQCEIHYTKNEFGCNIGAAIADWLFILLEVGVFGAVLTFLVSASGKTDGINETEDHRIWKTLKQTFGMVVLAYFTFAPLYSTNIDNALFMNRTREGLEWAFYFVVGLGFLLVYVQFTVIFRSLFPEYKFLYTPECTIRKEIFVKRASRVKIDKMYENAMELHSSFSVRSSQFYDRKKSLSSLIRMSASQGALLEFTKRENDVEPIARLNNFKIWALTDPIYDEEGVWIGARTWAGNLGQMLAVFAFAWFIAWSNRAVTESYKNDNPTQITVQVRTPSVSRGLYFNSSGSYVINTNDATPDFLLKNSLTFGYPFDTGVEVTQESRAEKFYRNVLHELNNANDVTAIWGSETGDNLVTQVEGALLNATGIDLKLAFFYLDLYNSFNGNFITFVVEQGKKRVNEREIKIALTVGGIFGTLAMIFVTSCYFPSGVAQILMLRHGSSISPLTDKRFKTLRLRPFQTTYLFAGAIWGVLATGLSTGVLTGSIIFFAVWSESYSLVIGLLAMLIGLSVSLIIRSILICSIRSKAHSAFYRKVPVLSNILSALLDTWSIAVAFGFILSRSLKLIITTCFYLGRIDSHMLDTNVNNVNEVITIDSLPDSFTIDLLLHDAHRHPYLERLGLIYMLKINKGKSFATRAGCSWRLLFTLALCPWLRSYRKDGSDSLNLMMIKENQ